MNTPDTPKQSAHRPQTRLPIGKVLMALLALAALAFPIATYLLLTKSHSPLAPDPITFMFLIIGNLLLLVIFGFIILKRAFRIWGQLREGSAGTKLQTRIITLFSLVTVVPTLIISIFSALFFNYGVQSWFDQRVSVAFEKSVDVATAYLEEHKESIRADAIAMGSDLRRDLHMVHANPRLFNKILNGQASLRSLTEASIIQNGREIARSRLSFSFLSEKLPDALYERAMNGEVLVMGQEDKILALVAMDAASRTFLLISRLVDASVLDYVEQTRGAASEYRKLQDRLSELQLIFSIVFILVSLVILMAVIWYGMGFASRLVGPIGQLVKAAEHVRAGDYSVSVPTLATSEEDEMYVLIDRFNRMVEQLNEQRNDLILSHRLLNERRRFIEAVLKSASAGVIAVSPELEIVLCNPSAEQLLNLKDEASYLNRPVTQLLPEIEDLLMRAKRQSEEPESLAASLEMEQEEDLRSRAVTGDITHNEAEQNFALHVNITPQKTGLKTEGYIITFDDISPLVSAQRRAAWSDVARRIAHEIKNPLTPIQLSVERLKKKFLPQSPEDQEKFLRYTDTIGRHSADIRTMIDEFASFARMPTPTFSSERIYNVLRDTVFSAKTAFEAVDFRLNIDDKEQMLVIDAGQIGQALTNLLKNAAEAMETRTKDAEPAYVEMDAYACRAGYVIDIKDNGIGFPVDRLSTIMEPYVTTRAKGTGLGLAIVKKTIEEHGGTFTVANREEGGAQVTITLPLAPSLLSQKN